MLPEFLQAKTIYLIVHVFGAILGAGGAFVGDTMFFSSIKDGHINKDELRFLKLGGKMVWFGLFILVVSGIFLVLTDPQHYLSSSKFLAKVTIVCVIILNGLIFHLIHFPHIRGHVGLKFNESPTFVKRAPYLLISGAISVVSWISTVILGMLRGVPYSYTDIMSLYLFIILIAVAGALFLKNTLFNLK